MPLAKSSCETIDETDWTANLGNFLERIEKFNLMDVLKVQITAAVQTASRNAIKSVSVLFRTVFVKELVHF